MTERVIPRQAMSAWSRPDTDLPERWNIQEATDLPTWLTDAEFAAAFRPADDLDRLVAAVRLVVDRRLGPKSTPAYGEGSIAEAEIALGEALRVWDGETS